jgi:hypothetical protein
VTAGNAAGISNRRTAVPLHARIGVLPIDGKGFVDLDVLAGLHAATAENALVGIVTVEGVGVVHSIGPRAERNLLVLNA